MWWILWCAWAAPQPSIGGAEEARLLDEVHAREPDKAARLASLKTSDPARYASLLMRAKHQLEREVREAELRAEIKALSVRWHLASDGEKRKLRAEMEVLGGQVFELLQEGRRQRIVELRERIELAAAEIDEQQANRDRLIAARLDRLLRTGE